MVYEHPLNETTRNYLRIEHLFLQLYKASELNDALSAHMFFKTLFDLSEVLERSDWRGDLLKDLVKIRQQLQLWTTQPGVDQAKLNELKEQLENHRKAINKATRVGDHLKDDRLLSSVRQRICLPGGNCSFDVPQLYHWLEDDASNKQKAIEQWLYPFRCIGDTVFLVLNLLRSHYQHNEVSATNGFYQGNAEGCSLLRIELDAKCHVYPTVSGHKSRFAIKFLTQDNQEPGDIPCHLFCCKLG